MTTTVPTASVRAAAGRPGADEPDLTGFTLVHRALRSGTRMLAEAFDGIARDDACGHERRRDITWFAHAVLREVDDHLHREDVALWPLAVVGTRGWADLASLSADHGELQRLLRRAAAALPIFARDASAGAPLLAEVFADLADLLEVHLAEEEARVFPLLRRHVSRAELEQCRARLRSGTAPGRLLFLLPWLADQCHPAELRHVLAETAPRTRLVLRLGRPRYTRGRDAVLGLGLGLG